MLDTRYSSIVYQSQVYVSALVDSLIQAKKKLGKSREGDWKKADLIISYLEALQETPKLTDDSDLTNVTFILECLCVLCNISSFPTAPTLLWTGPPSLIVGAKGDKGDKGDKGNNGATGLATDFLAGPSNITIVVDTFPITDAKAARWDYVVIENGGAERAGSVIGHWKSDGTLTSSADTADDDTVASTDGIEFDVQATSTTVYFIATITSGTWTISGSRYFIPNNGNGTGPISGLLPNGKVYIGNSFNSAQDQYLSGAISLVDNTGVVQINPSYIVNSMVAPTAGILVSKLQTLPASKLVVTDSSGVFTTTNSPTLTEVGYLGGVTSSIQTQLGTKLTDPTTSIGDLIIRNVSNNIARLPIGSSSQVLTVVGGVPTWQNPAAGFADPMTTAGDIIIRNGSNVTSRLGIGTTGQLLTVVGGVPTWQTFTTGGTVTSITATQPSAGLTISGSPITTSGTLTFNLSDDLAAVEALSSTGIVRRTAPNVWSAGGLVLPTEGGTNISSYTTGDILYASGTNTLSRLGIGTFGQVLRISGGVPTWSSIDSGLFSFTLGLPSTTIQNLSRGWYYYDMLDNINIVFGGGNALGTVVTLSRVANVVTDSPVPNDSAYSNTITTNAFGSLLYKGRYVTSIPASARNITFMMVATAGGIDYWKVVGEDADARSQVGASVIHNTYVPTFSNLTGLQAPTIVGGNFKYTKQLLSTGNQYLITIRGVITTHNNPLPFGTISELNFTLPEAIGSFSSSSDLIGHATGYEDTSSGNMSVSGSVLASTSTSANVDFTGLPSTTAGTYLYAVTITCSYLGSVI